MRIMSEQTKDEKWTAIGAEVKVLTLEHDGRTKIRGFLVFLLHFIKFQNIK